MTTKTLIVSLLLLFVSVPSRAARCGVREDSCTVREAVSAFRPREAFRRNFSYMGIPLVVSGVLVMPDNDDFRKLRNRFIPKFHNEYDNYTQYLPLAATWGMKLAGVKGRSSWKELAVSNAFSAALMAGAVNTLKYTVREMRPDNTTANSFPSGHTATAFMCATILHKEYGHLSPWYSVGGYMLAGLTGVTRQLNNRHWVGDVLVGAGIGIIATDLGYFLSDLIFKPDYAAVASPAEFRKGEKPSFLAFNIGMSVALPYLRPVRLSPVGMPAVELTMRTPAATHVAVEGACFFTPYVGLGGRLRAMSAPVLAGFSEVEKQESDLPVGLFELRHVESDRFGILDVDMGLYLSFPVSRRLRVGTKLLTGKRLMSGLELNAVCRVNPAVFDRGKVSEADYERHYKPWIDGYMQEQGISSFAALVEKDLPRMELVRIGRADGFQLGTGLSVSYRCRENAVLRLYADYDMSALQLRYAMTEPGRSGREAYSEIHRTAMHDFSAGAAFAFIF